MLQPDKKNQKKQIEDARAKYNSVLATKYKDSKINVDTNGATPKPYPKTRSKSVDRNGNEMTEIRDSTKKMLFSGKSNDVKTKEAVQSFKKDSTGYANAADYDAKDYNLKQTHNNAESMRNSMAFVGKKKK